MQKKRIRFDLETFRAYRQKTSRYSKLRPGNFVTPLMGTRQFAEIHKATHFQGGYGGGHGPDVDARGILAGKA